MNIHAAFDRAAGRRANFAAICALSLSVLGTYTGGCAYGDSQRVLLGHTSPALEPEAQGLASVPTDSVQDGN